MIAVDPNAEPPRESRVLDGPPDAEVEIHGRRFVYFGGTSYLGLHARPEPIDAACSAMRRHGLHAATSRTGFGETPPLRDLEAELARFFAAGRSFHFASGWAGAGIWAALERRDEPELIAIDERSHYAVFEAARALGAPVHSFAHRDPDALRDVLRDQARPGARVVVATDGCFPITGAMAPLADYLAVLDERPHATLLVDDAHGVGVLGEHGRGSVEHAGLDERCFVHTDAPTRVRLAATLSKALGGFGGFVVGGDADVDAARRSSHWLEGASAPPVPVATASATALRLARAEPQLRTRLRHNVARLRGALADLGLDVPRSLPTPAIGFTVGDATAMHQLAATLRTAGLLVPYFPSYSGLGADGALRVAVFATHTDAHLDQLVDALRDAL